MKQRTVKVTVWPVRQTGQAGIAISPELRAAIRDSLEKIISYQTNAWFELDFKIPGEADLVDAEVVDPLLPGHIFKKTYCNGTKEKAMINEHADPDADIRVFLITTPAYVEYVDGPNDKALDGFSYPSQGASSGIYQNSCVIKRQDNQGKIVRAFVHEIGHILVGTGHPNQPDAPSGPAPLQNVNPGQHTKRLMCWGPLLNEDSKLLLKAEWDEAEKWLQDFPDQRE